MDKSQRAHAFHQWLRQSILCPITKMVIVDPVVAADGIVYERQAIEKWFLRQNKSPSTGLTIRQDLVPLFFFKSLVEKFLEYKPELVEEQYQLQKLNHCDHIEAVKKIFITGNYGQLLNYHHFTIKNLGLSSLDLTTTLVKIPFNVFQYFVENSNNLDVDIPGYRKRLIHHVAEAGRSDLVIYLVKRGVDITSADVYGMLPMHYVFQKCGLDAVQYFLERDEFLNTPNNVKEHPIHFVMANSKIKDDELLTIMDKFQDLGCETSDKSKPIHLACKYRGETIINYLIEKQVNLNEPNSKSMYPVHYLLMNYRISCENKIKLLEHFKDLECKNASDQRPIHIACNTTDNNIVIKYLVDRGVDLECEDNKKWRPIHFLCYKKPSVPMILYLLDKKIDLECTTSSGKKPIHFLARPSTLTIAKLLQDRGAKIEDLSLESDSDDSDQQEVESNF